MNMRSKLRTRVGASLIIAVLLYNEWFCLWVDRWNWRLAFSMKDVVQDSQRILLVADAQIQGYESEPPFPWGSITRWDSDRFLHNGYMAAVQHFHPDIIIFLGDELDEGSTATSKQFIKYKSRFTSLFPIPKNTMGIFLPGDNDIGGEGMDLITENKLLRFHEAFGKETYMKTKIADFIKVDLLSQSGSFKTVPKRSNNLRVVLTHIPLTMYRSKFTNMVLETVEPDLIISAHEHTSYVIEGERTTGKLLEMDSFVKPGHVKEFNIRGPRLHEIIVPTCSYRMGVSKMGYGAAILSADGTVNYSIFWLTSRYFHLYLYAIALVIELFVFYAFFVHVFCAGFKCFTETCRALTSSLCRRCKDTFQRRNITV